MNPTRARSTVWNLARLASLSFRAGTVCSLSLLSLGRASAAEAEAASPEPNLFDKIWHYTEWYQNEENPVIQRFQFTGRFQLDYALVDAHQGDHDEWNVRRFRVGGKAKLFHHLTLHGEADLNPQEPHPLYQRLTDMYLAWSRSPVFTVTVGKHSAPFTMDGSTSSKELLTVERNNLANNIWFPEEYFPGVSLSGRPGPWRYHAGIYSAGAENKEFGEFNGGVFFLGKLGYDFGKALGVKQALLAADYVYQETDRNNTFTRRLQQVGSLHFSYDTGRWGFRSELAGAEGYLGQPDLWGAMIMPFYNLTDKLQVVGRYTHLSGNNENALRLTSYENRVVPGRGDEYNAFYFGLNYFFYGHKLKLQTGAQYAEMDDRARDGGAYRGWSWMTGLRIGW